MKISYHHNLYYLYLIKVSKWLMLTMPIVALFYNENGLTSFDIFLLQAVYSISVSIMEIPSGYMADFVGRKKTLIIGSILGTLGFVIYSCSYSFTGFLIAEIILGIGGSFISGADSALLFDSLAAVGKKHTYLQYEGRITSLGNFAETAAAICGGAIAGLLCYRAVYVSQTVIAGIAIPAAFLLLEPPREVIGNHPGIKHILSICKTTLFIDKKLSSTILFSSVTGIATLSMAWSSQIYFVTEGLTEVSITPLWVALNLTVALVAAFAAQTKKILGNKVSFLLIIIYIPLSYILLGMLSLVPALVALFLFYAVRGYATPVLKDLINMNCEAATRATVLSIRNMIIRFGFALLGPSIGYLSGAFNLSAAFIFAGFLLLILSTLTGYRLYIQLPATFNTKN